MSSKSASRLLLILLCTVFCGACDQSRFPRRLDRTTGDDYLPVDAEMLTGAQYTGRTGGYEYDDLQWTFGEQMFEIIAGENGMPDDLMQTLLSSDTPPDRINGHWEVEGEELTLSNISADGKAIDQPPVTIRTMCTPVIRIEPRSAQYTFLRKP